MTMTIIHHRRDVEVHQRRRLRAGRKSVNCTWSLKRTLRKRCLSNGGRKLPRKVPNRKLGKKVYWRKRHERQRKNLPPPKSKRSSIPCLFWRPKRSRKVRNSRIWFCTLLPRIRYRTALYRFEFLAFSKQITYAMQISRLYFVWFLCN